MELERVNELVVQEGYEVGILFMNGEMILNLEFKFGDYLDVSELVNVSHLLLEFREVVAKLEALDDERPPHYFPIQVIQLLLD